MTDVIYRPNDRTAPPPPNYKMYAIEYRGFLIARETSEYVLYSIKTIDDGKPPPSLRGSFTLISKASAAIDNFLQEEHNARTTNNPL
jgi:hypothetical protein